jgi:hypothetical protein
MSTLKTTNLQHASAASPSIVLASDGSATAQLSSITKLTSINGGPVGGNRNLLINGGFDIWQRGTSFSSPSAISYLADRWMVEDVSSAGTISRQSFTTGQTDVPGNPTYFIRVAQTGTTYYRLCQRIEAINNNALGGETCTLSFWAKSSTSSNIQNIFFSQQNFTSGARTDVNVSSAFALTTSWQRYVFTGTYASVVGKTIGASTYASVEIYLQNNTTATVDIANVQLEVGTSATPFERRSYGQELALAQRYFNTVKSIVGTSGATTTTLYTNIGYEMRAAPTFAVTGALQITEPGTANYTQSAGLVTSIRADSNGAYISFGNFTGLTANRPYLLSGTTNYLTLNAEL